MTYKYIESEKRVIRLEERKAPGCILDIGGGGEGFIGNLYGQAVIAIDTRLDELEDLNNDSIKLVMDGSDLAFTDNNFDLVTLFYSLMYMGKETRQAVLAEATRVLKPGGLIELWDVELPKAMMGQDWVFLAHLVVDYMDTLNPVTYGVGLDQEGMTCHEIESYLRELEMELVKINYQVPMFHMVFKKSNLL